MKDEEIRDGFTTLQLEHLYNNSYSGIQEYTKKFTKVSALKSVPFTVTTSSGSQNTNTNSDYRRK